MKISHTLGAAAILAAGVSLSANAASLSWDAFVIRNANGTGDVPTIVENADGVGVTTSILESGQKTGYGTTGLDGQTIGSILGLSYDRLDAGTKDTYLNIWVTDGTNYALISPVVGATPSGDYPSTDVRGYNLQTLGFNIYDNSAADYNWLYTGATRTKSLLTASGNVVTLADIANLTIGENPTHVADTGAPQNGDGFNIIFGDTQGNFTSPIPYQIDNVQVATAVPLPSAATMGLGMLGLIAAAGFARKKLAIA